METLVLVVAAASLAAWVHLVFGHGGFWRCDQRLDEGSPAPAAWPDVTAVVPARNEADVLAETLGSLLDQDYPGRFHVVLVDDESDDGTAAEARRVADAHPHGGRLSIERTPPRPPGWVGKMWALETGLRRARAAASQDAGWWLLTDADVRHHPGSVRRLVARGEAGALDLVSLMVMLRAETPLERLTVPAFVYFFQKLYPFPRVNDPRARTAGAAGGCMLVRREALVRAGGLAPLRGEVIDDCALGRALKRGGPIWLGLSTADASVRGYGGLGGVWHMVARSAFTQLRHSRALLAGTLVGLALLYGAPPALVAAACVGIVTPLAGALGGAAWLLMSASFAPTLALYGRPAPLALALPVAGLLYAGMTLDSARRHGHGAGAAWKGRVGAGSGR